MQKAPNSAQFHNNSVFSGHLRLAYRENDVPRNNKMLYINSPLIKKSSLTRRTNKEANENFFRNRIRATLLLQMKTIKYCYDKLNYGCLRCLLKYGSIYYTSYRNFRDIWHSVCWEDLGKDKIMAVWPRDCNNFLFNITCFYIEQERYANVNRMHAGCVNTFN